MVGHIPVLAEEVLTMLRPESGQDFIDGTVGLGGHASLILEKTGPEGRLLAFDRDVGNLQRAKETLKRFGDRIVFVHDSFATLAYNARVHGFTQVDGVLLDLGFSSVHVDDPSRGFSFQNAGPLDMRYDVRQELTAAGVVNSWRAEDLADIFRHYGEERHAYKIAKMIVEGRRRARIQSTTELAELVARAIPTPSSSPFKRGRVHPATRVFQALRIAVNDELNELDHALPQTLDVLKTEGKLAVISFHSLEDRPVKQFMRAHAGKELKILTKRPIVAGEEEIKINPRSRSAKLRVAERL